MGQSEARQAGGASGLLPFGPFTPTPGSRCGQFQTLRFAAEPHAKKKKTNWNGTKKRKETTHPGFLTASQSLGGETTPVPSKFKSSCLLPFLINNFPPLGLLAKFQNNHSCPD